MATARKPDWKAVGAAVVRRRAELGLRQEDVVARIVPPISIDTLRKIEGGQRAPRLTTLALVSRALDWPHDALDRISRHLPPDDAPPVAELDQIKDRLDRLEENVDRLLAHLDVFSRDVVVTRQTGGSAREGR